jgi:uncharacterized protein YcsI (UPF0317 family)
VRACFAKAKRTQILSLQETGVMPDTIMYPDTADFRTDLPPNSVYKTGKTDSSEDFSFSILS